MEQMRVGSRFMKQFTLQAEKEGWQLALVSGDRARFRCSKIGCPGFFDTSTNTTVTPGPCQLPHQGEYAERAVDGYQSLVDQLRQRRHSLGLSLQAVDRAGGFAEGHISKIERGARTATIPTLALWAETLGYKITLAPSPLPAVTVSEIEDASRTKRAQWREMHLKNAIKV